MSTETKDQDTATNQEAGPAQRFLTEGMKATWLASASPTLNELLGELDKGDDFRFKWEILQSGAYHPFLRAVRHKDQPQVVHAAISHEAGALCTDDGNQLLYVTCCGLTTYEAGEGYDKTLSDPDHAYGPIMVPNFKSVGDAASWTGYFVGVRGDNGNRYVDELAFSCPECLKHEHVAAYEAVVAQTTDDVKPLVELQEALQ